MATLPFLPGMSLQSPSDLKKPKSQHFGLSTSFMFSVSRCHQSMTQGRGCFSPSLLEFKNGIPIQKKTSVDLTEDEISALENFNLSKTKSPARVALPPVVPAHVALDKKVLLFNAYFKQTVHESPLEFFRVRYVKIYYYLEDDTISIVEPVIENSGLPQGKLTNRQKIPKDNAGNSYSWKDLNIGWDIVVYARAYHIYDCNAWTKTYLTSQGVEVAEPEQAAVDQHATTRLLTDKPDVTQKTPSDFDKLKQFIAFDRRVLRFFCIWDDRDQLFGELRKFVLHYYLVDDTVEIREAHESNDGRDPFPVLLKRQKVPRNPRDLSPDFPTIALELKETELTETLGPEDFAIGQYVFVYGRPFFLYECDEFTKEFYRQNFGETDFGPIQISEPRNPPPKPSIPPHIGIGTAEDSVQSCIAVVPKPPKTDYTNLFEFGNSVLRFAARFEKPNPEDAARRFIVSFHLANDQVSIHEPPQRNSGIIGGKFLSARRVQLPGSDRNHPTYYSAKDFRIGAIVEANKHRFILEDADEFVHKIVQQYPELF